MQSTSRRIAALVCVAMLIAGVGYWLTQSRADRPLDPPPLSATAEKKLARIDADLGFKIALLQKARDEGDKVEKVASQWVTRGKFTADGADFDSALLLLDKADKHLPRPDPRVAAVRVHTYSSRHRFVEARAFATEALKQFPGDELLLELQADAALYSGDMEAGSAGFRHLIEANAEGSTPWVGLAYWAEITGDLEQAMDLLQKALNSTYPTPLGYDRQAYIHSVMGEVRSKQGDQKEARRQFGWAMAKSANYPAARNGLADVAQWEGKDDEAEMLLRGLIESESPNADYQIKLADLLDRHGKKEEAAKLRKEAETFYDWSVSTGFDGYVRPLATLKLAEGNYKRAAELAARDLEIRPTTESKQIYDNVLAQAKAAGKPVDVSSLHKIVPKPIKEPEQIKDAGPSKEQEPKNKGRSNDA